MATTYRPIKGEDRECLLRMCTGMFLEGQCYEFALALHRGLGWPIIGLIHQDTIFHALVRDPEGNHWDSRGKLKDSEISAPFCVPSPPELREVTYKELLSVREGNGLTIVEHSIETASCFSQTLWPELPWKDTRASKIQHFLADLEELSRRYGIWIRGPVPAASPHLSEEFGEESGYWFAPTVDGFGFYFDRNLK